MVNNLKNCSTVYFFYENDAYRFMGHLLFKHFSHIEETNETNDIFCWIVFSSYHSGLCG